MPPAPLSSGIPLPAGGGLPQPECLGLELGTGPPVPSLGQRGNLLGVSGGFAMEEGRGGVQCPFGLGWQEACGGPHGKPLPCAVEHWTCIWGPRHHTE